MKEELILTISGEESEFTGAIPADVSVHENEEKKKKLIKKQMDYI